MPSSSSADLSSPSDIVRQIETGKTGRSHLRVLMLSGAGVYMDGYDLFIISVALLPLKQVFHTTPLDVSAISSAAILGAVFGAVIFGNLADRLGRKMLYVIDLVFFVVFGAASAFSQSVFELVLFRFLLGIGIGADYPISASYIAEFVSSKDRGKLIASVFAFQGLGILSAVGVSIYFLTVGAYVLQPWQWMLLSGVFPAIIALTLRTRMPETPRWYLSHGQATKAKEVMSKFFGYPVSEEQVEAVVEKASVRELLLSPYARRVFFTSASWFLVDIGVYGIGILTPTLIASIYGPKSPPIASAETAGILYVFAGFGYLSSIALVDIAGRKKIQIAGFFGMAIPLAFAAYYTSLSLTGLLALFAVFYVMENLGPNPTTWIYPVELFPTRLRGTGHGIAATVGKVGALFATFVLSLVLLAVGRGEFLAIVSLACFAGGFLTMALGTETKRLSLDDVSEIFKSFYDTLDGISRNVISAAELLESTLAGRKLFDAKKLEDEMKEIEHSGDNLVHDAFTKLSAKFVAPIDREDITALLRALDDVLDFIDASAARLEIYRVKEVTPEMVEFSKIILEQARAIREAVLSLKGGRAELVIREASIKIDELENRADALLHDTLRSLFENARDGSAFEVMKIKEIYEYFETTTDRAEDVSDVLRNLMVKYTL
jgi:putative MFS transporter